MKIRIKGKHSEIEIESEKEQEIIRYYSEEIIDLIKQTTAELIKIEEVQSGSV